MKFKLFGKIITVVLVIELLALTLLFMANNAFKVFNERDNLRNIQSLLLKMYHHRVEFEISRDTIEANRFYSNLSKVDDLIKELPEQNVYFKIIDLKDSIKKHFSMLEKNIYQRGLNEESGLEGKFRHSVHKVEELIKPLNNDKMLVNMLMARRSEKDFIMRRKLKYIDRVENSINNLIDNAQNQIDNNELKSIIIKNSQTYLDLFESLSYIYNNIDFHKSKLNEFELSVQTNLNLIINKKAKQAKRIQNILILTFIFSILIGIIISVITARGISKPVKILRDSADKIANGDFTEEIKITNTDEIGDLQRVFISVRNNIKKLTEELEKINSAAQNGQLKVRGEAELFKGDYKKIINGFNNTLDNIINPVNLTSEYLDHISNGILPEKIKNDFNGDFHKIINNLNVSIDAINNMVDDVNYLSLKTREGQLHKRAKAERHSGKFKEIIVGFNKTLDSLTMPISEASEKLKKIAKGEIPEQITKNYYGEFNKIKNNLNSSIDSLILMSGELEFVIEQLKIGNISQRCEPNKLNGIYKELIMGVNHSVDIITNPMKDISNILNEYAEGNFAKKMENLPGEMVLLSDSMNKIKYNLQIVTDDIRMLMNNLLNGELTLRADERKHQGEFKNIISGFNSLLNIITNPLIESSQVLKSMSEGDFSEKVKGNYKGEFLKLKNSINNTVDSINYILNEVGNMVQIVNTKSQNMSEISQNLSHASYEQEASIKDILSTLHKVKDNTNKNSNDSVEADKIAFESTDKVEKGNNEMKKLEKSMNNIIASSNKINKIIKVIDEIAFQTNLLALNAAVEAARAGVHGQGFAVVAEEVRNLASRSATAAKETENLINDSILKIEEGNRISKKTSKYLSEISVLSNKVKEKLDNISDSSKIQLEDIETLYSGFKEISLITENNSEKAEEGAKSAETLNSNADKLMLLQTRFKLS